jgi:hypothetical protein
MADLDRQIAELIQRARRPLDQYELANVRVLLDLWCGEKARRAVAGTK